VKRTLHRAAGVAAVVGAALALALPAAAATPATALDVDAARAVAHAFIVKAAKKAGITTYYFACSQVQKTSVGPAVLTYFGTGSENDAIVVVKAKGAYKVAGVMPVKAISCGRSWDLAA
jgi:hypothetical protein